LCREAKHSLPYNSEVSTELSSTSTAPYAFMACTCACLLDLSGE